MTEEIAKRLNPDPGRYALPLMKYAGVRGTEDPGVIRLVFEAETGPPSSRSRLTITVPIATLDATGLLGNLKRLQEMGLLPILPTAPTSKQ